MFYMEVVFPTEKILINIWLFHSTLNIESIQLYVRGLNIMNVHFIFSLILDFLFCIGA